MTGFLIVEMERCDSQGFFNGPLLLDSLQYEQLIFPHDRNL